MEPPACAGCRERDAEISRLEARVAALEEQVRQLKGLLGRNASNSSVPPSANPPAAPKPVVKEKTGRQPGAQPGHPPHLKQWLPAERVTKLITFVPSHCPHCQTALPKEAQPADPEPTRFQVADLPPVHGRQLCWAHRIRDFQGLVDLGGKSKTFGNELLLLADAVFHWWYRVRDGTLSRSTLRT